MSVMSESSKTSKSEKTKRRIVDAYFTQMTSTNWDKITVKEICAEAGITRGTFYQYYNSIYDIVEQEETALLNDITARYAKIPRPPQPDTALNVDPELNYQPPPSFIAWFDFCRDNPIAMKALLNKQFGDHYFVKRLKEILQENIAYLMEIDGQPDDTLRAYYMKIFLELHFMAALAWLERGEDEFLSVSQIVTLLNTMRVGANYLSYAERNHKEDACSIQ